ncbi:hypothetical protein BN874_2010002 [Candidatus Contendobacter odensis Run_B_J11]|uniref:Uncharacterized protein n=1 Tax=Candidatus Contendobacter odensis Run_B_J11 TaxID=1400861 RepID=A0A7U7GBC5_9GAMM|nr:hypothetical protein BN874_2010002 [Candidatus Contendobacter odensis Run_B_J11]
MGLTVPGVSWILYGPFNDRGEFTMAAYRSLSYTKWDCKYPIVFIPKRRKKVIQDFRFPSFPRRRESSKPLKRLTGYSLSRV